jgi:hypothetical protein
MAKPEVDGRELHDHLMRLRAMQAETTDPIATRFLHDIVWGEPKNPSFAARLLGPRRLSDPGKTGSVLKPPGFFQRLYSLGARRHRPGRFKGRGRSRTLSGFHRKE